MVVVAGTVYLGGGGSTADEAVLWRAMLAGKSRIIHWPFALPPERTHTAGEWLTGALRDLDVHVDVETWTELSGHAPDQLASADLLFVGGGNTFRLLGHVREHGFVGAVRDFVAGGGDFYGGSAGALLACTDVEMALRLDENVLGLTDFSALGLVGSFDVLPHFTPTQLGDAMEWGSQRGRVVLGIPERSGVAVRDGMVEVLGHEPVWELAGGDAIPRVPGERWGGSSEAGGPSHDRVPTGASDRAVAVVLREDRVLVIQRHKRGRDYCVLPGGGVEPGETPEVAVLRELREETGLTGSVNRKLWTLEHDDRVAHYFLVETEPGDPVLGGPEALRQSDDNSYRPQWIPIDRLEEDNLQPEVLPRMLVDLAS
jgi:8-oxo-dGTP pyrophosphatase MutT (NUDIX family)/peptidase E